MGESRVADGGDNFCPVPDDPLITHESLDIVISIVGNALWIEPVKRGTEAGTSTQDGDPRESGLKCFETEFFEELHIAVQCPAPLLVVIALVFGIRPGPGAARPAVGADLYGADVYGADRYRADRYRAGRPGEGRLDRFVHERCSMPSWSSNHAFVAIPSPALKPVMRPLVASTL